MSRLDDKHLWRRASDTMQRITAGEVKPRKGQAARLQKLLDGEDQFNYADSELKRAILGLMFERQVYLSKLWMLEKLGVKNQWKHDLLVEFRSILYEEAEGFKLDDYLANKK
jgi:hypothetical protein